MNLKLLEQGFALFQNRILTAARVYKDLDMTKNHPNGNTPKEIQRN
jgi:hypothetical protein